MKSCVSIVAVVGVILAQMSCPVEGFVKGSSGVHRSPVEVHQHHTRLMAKKAAKKAASKKAASKKAPVDTLKKAELLGLVAEKLDSTKTEADEALTAVLETIQESVVDGKRVSLPGFGIFTLRDRAARKGRNPKTGAVLDIAASKSPGFTAAKAFKEAANE